MNKLFFGIMLAVANITISHAQVIATIGIGETSYAKSTQGPSLGYKSDVVNELNTQIRQQLLATRKFKVFDNSQLTSLLDKRVLSLDSFNTSVPHNDVLLQAGLDYILNADIVNLNTYAQNRSRQSEPTGLIEINLFLQGVAHSTEDFRLKITTFVPLQSNNQEVSLITKQIISAGADQVVDQIITKLFPIRIVQIYEDERLKLNAGSGILSIGDTIYLHEESNIGEVFDTLREPLKRTDVVLQVVSVDKRFSIAQALGNFDKVKKRMVGKLQLNEF